MHVVPLALVIGSHSRGIKLDEQLRCCKISSDWSSWSMKWLSMFGRSALVRFSCRKHGETDSSRNEFNIGDRPA
ncbi:hypothetical protein [Bradyrhizobium liaoningense]|uniref:hypothetical protein n=1 Tax=Bradyrhizobium liaoningense TaxID=43992 RepID=UPI001BAAD291|nr:hypothetical protein [Bradyrhizobium liaoningense]MBR0854608.1 hypothetical protein [Bradyrhizobium liaoningense]